MAEWTKASVLKTDDPQGSVGSNPTPSAPLSSTRACYVYVLRNRGGIDPERVEAVLQAGGRLGVREVLHCRVRYFSDGMILGSRGFVEEMFNRHRGNFGVQRQSGARPMRGARWKGLYAARRLQLDPVTPAPVC